MSLSRLVDLHRQLRATYPFVTGVVRPINGTPYATFEYEPTLELQAAIQAEIDAFDWTEEEPIAPEMIQAAMNELTAEDKMALLEVLLRRAISDNPNLLEAVGKNPKKAKDK